MAKQSATTFTGTVTLDGTLATGLLKNTTSTGALSSVAAPAGAIVGDTDSQTLSNKTISGTTITDGTDIVLGSSTGTKIGTATTQKLGFFNSGPVIRPSNTADLGTVLSSLGLRGVGTAYPITTSGAVTLTGAVAMNATTLATDTATGLKIGTAGGASGQKLGFYNATPIVQPLLATGASHTVDDVITVLQNLGLVRQS